MIIFIINEVCLTNAYLKLTNHVSFSVHSHTKTLIFKLLILADLTSRRVPDEADCWRNLARYALMGAGGM